MKNYGVICSLLCLIVVVNAVPHLERKNGSSKVKVTLTQCLIEHSIDPAVLEPNSRDEDLRDSLSDEKRGCLMACVYRAFHWMRPDGTFDIDLLAKGVTSEESEAKKKKYLKMIEECRKEVGKDDCKFFRCLHLKDI
ncbi:uncharacterized protein LOC106637883 [Copidosoma floridanum]|uniref:uncharacterized protein LOC106637883 n=1 Tax=Copidosoma floridanum TaxID=29053 RepID=UPI0006C956ED|nr:uncharacterized protein LOC106637883 [Copidosoma floridanum]